MRIHELTIEAFGPFAGRACVDLDALSDAGLFLLTGATGAGKTSVLDAVCFALYGAVPGDRQAAKRLRSDQAASGVAPAVSMEFTVDGRRLRIDRTAGWHRPKKRGTGLTLQQPSVLVRERVDGEWQSLSSRLDEAGHLVTGLLGMNLTQFCQVQLLPQGRFQAFLRADSAERHQLLQQLFRTDHFAQVESWLRDRRRTLGRESARHHDTVAGLVSRVSEASAQPLPGDWVLHALEPCARAIRPWANGLLTAAVLADGEAEQAATRAARGEAEARSRLEAGRRLAERQQRVNRARSEQATLTDEQPAHVGRLRRRDAAVRANSVLPVARMAEHAATDLAAGETRANASVRRAGELLDTRDLPAPELRAQEREALGRGAAARALSTRVAERDRLLTQQAEARSRLVALEADLARADERFNDLPTAIARRRTAQAQARQADDALAAARDQLEEARKRRDAGLQVLTLTAQRIDAEDLLRVSVDEAQSATAAWLELQELRLNGMAAEIALDLAVGACCPVCGSADHPRPARTAPGAPDAAAVRSARRAVDDAEVVRQARAGAVADLQTRISHARERAGDHTVSALERELVDHRDRLARLEALARTLPTAVHALAEIENELATVNARRGALTAERSGLIAHLTEWAERVDDIQRELDAQLAGTDHTSVAALARHHDAVARACGEAAAALTDLDRLRAAAVTSTTRAEAAAVDHGFDSASQARDAALSADTFAALDQQVRSHEAHAAAVAAVLAEPDLVDAAAVPSPDLVQLATGQAAADEALMRARTAAAARHRRADRLTRLVAELEEAVGAWEPVRSQYELADRLATLTDGTSPDNRLRMRLSGYVLAFRLRQVVAAANERLVTMTDRRYRLEHSGDRGAGESRGGLSLRVRDDWSGETRDPVTLSGGETFVVSLALALGLADVIAHEAGGSELDTLFVDEGFGSLDADTLDDVMDTLDSLRDGGRVVGVVSHVAELRDRIPTQLHVRKHRSGSTVHQDAVV